MTLGERLIAESYRQNAAPTGRRRYDRIFAGFPEWAAFNEQLRQENWQIAQQNHSKLVNPAWRLPIADGQQLKQERSEWPTCDSPKILPTSAIWI